MTLTHADVRKVFEILDETAHWEYVEISIGDYVLKAGKTKIPPGTESPLPRCTDVVAATSEPAVQESPQSIQPVPDAVTGPDTRSAGTVPPQPDTGPDHRIPVLSPMAGTFYLTPGPGEPAFVSENAWVEEGDTVCLVEVMKLFNSIKAPVSGKVTSINARHGEPVLHDEVLMIIEPGEEPGGKR